MLILPPIKIGNVIESKIHLSRMWFLNNNKNNNYYYQEHYDLNMQHNFGASCTVYQYVSGLKSEW